MYDTTWYVWYTSNNVHGNKTLTTICPSKKDRLVFWAHKIIRDAARSVKMHTQTTQYIPFLRKVHCIKYHNQLLCTHSLHFRLYKNIWPTCTICRRVYIENESGKHRHNRRWMERHGAAAAAAAAAAHNLFYVNFSRENERNRTHSWALSRNTLTLTLWRASLACASHRTPKHPNSKTQPSSPTTPT